MGRELRFRAILRLTCAAARSSPRRRNRMAGNFVKTQDAINPRTVDPSGIGNVLRAAPVVVVCAMVVSCASAKTSASRALVAGPSVRGAAVYVTDFELWAQDPKSERTLVPPHPADPGQSAGSNDPAVRAYTLIELMATSLVDDLTAAGFRASRLRPGDALPAEGWLVRGIFTRTDQRNGLRRAIVRTGDVQTDMQLFVVVDDLARGLPQRFYSFPMRARVGAVVSLNPAVEAAKFTLSGHDLEAEAKQHAAAVAAEVAQRLARPSH